MCCRENRHLRKSWQILKGWIRRREMTVCGHCETLSIFEVWNVYGEVDFALIPKTFDPHANVEAWLERLSRLRKVLHFWRHDLTHCEKVVPYWLHEAFVYITRASPRGRGCAPRVDVLRMSMRKRTHPAPCLGSPLFRFVGDCLRDGGKWKGRTPKCRERWGGVSGVEFTDG